MKLKRSQARIATYFGLAEPPLDPAFDVAPSNFAECEPASVPQPHSSFYAIKDVSQTFVEQLGVDLARSDRSRKMFNAAAWLSFIVACLYPFSPVG